MLLNSDDCGSGLILYPWVTNGCHNNQVNNVNQSHSPITKRFCAICNSIHFGPQLCDANVPNHAQKGFCFGMSNGTFKSAG